MPDATRLSRALPIFRSSFEPVRLWSQCPKAIVKVKEALLGDLMRDTEMIVRLCYQILYHGGRLTELGMLMSFDVIITQINQCACNKGLQNISGQDNWKTRNGVIKRLWQSLHVGSLSNSDQYPNRGWVIHEP